VPEGSSRLRLAATASHTAADMRMAAGVLGDAARELGLDPATIGSSSSAPEDAQDADEGQELDTRWPVASPSSGPFDFERREEPTFERGEEATFERGEEATWAAVSASATPPAPVGAARPNAPFDGERESSIRAA